jgi:excisionase family DNA binding protein
VRTRIEEVVDDKDVLLTGKEVCERLKVTPRWLRRADEKGLLPRTKVGMLNRYYESGVEAYISANHVPARGS